MVAKNILLNEEKIKLKKFCLRKKLLKVLNCFV